VFLVDLLNLLYLPVLFLVCDLLRVVFNLLCLVFCRIWCICGVLSSPGELEVSANRGHLGILGRKGRLLKF